MSKPVEAQGTISADSSLSNARPTALFEADEIAQAGRDSIKLMLDVHQQHNYVTLTHVCRLIYKWREAEGQIGNRPDLQAEIITDLKVQGMDPPTSRAGDWFCYAAIYLVWPDRINEEFNFDRKTAKDYWQRMAKAAFYITTTAQIDPEMIANFLWEETWEGHLKGVGYSRYGNMTWDELREGLHEKPAKPEPEETEEQDKLEDDATEEPDDEETPSAPSQGPTERHPTRRYLPAEATPKPTEETIFKAPEGWSVEAGETDTTEIVVFYRDKVEVEALPNPAVHTTATANIEDLRKAIAATHPKNGIGWCNATRNPIGGCQKICTGCAFCYAVEVAVANVRKMQRKYEPTVFQRDNGRWDWTGLMFFDPDQLRVMKTPHKVFSPSMSDWFYEDTGEEVDPELFEKYGVEYRYGVKPEWRQQGFDFYDTHTSHVFQFLTKRPDVMRRFIADRYGKAGAPPHLWFGTSIGDNKDAVFADALRDANAAIKFLSIEPLVGPVDEVNLDGFQWVIVGGESGKKEQYRAYEQEWADDIAERCAAAGIPLYFKQTFGTRPEKEPVINGRQWLQFPFGIEQQPKTVKGTEK